MQQDVEKRDERQATGCARQDAVQPPAQSPSGGRKRHGEGRRAAHDEEEEGEVEEPPFGEDDAHRLRRAGELIEGDARARSALDDVEHERARDGIRIRRDDPPADRVGSGREVRREPDRDLAVERLGDVAVVDPLPVAVEHAQRAERDVDRLVELEGHLGGRLRHDDVVPGLRRDEDRMREGAR